MIIYQAMAGRLYPKIVGSIVEAVDSEYSNVKNKQIKDFHHPIVLCNESDYVDVNNVLKMIPSTLKHERFEGMLHGVFSTSNLNKKEEDFHFTIINHPIDQIYELFARLNFLRNRNILYPNFNSIDDYIIDPLNELDLDDKLSILFKSNKLYSLEEYIDMFLNQVPIYLYHNGIKYQPIRELFYGYENIQDFNYIGKFSEIKKTFKSLSEIFDSYIKPFDSEHAISYIGNFYKRDLLEKMFEDQIELYENIKC
jgi:hypothetical protein